MHMGLRLAVAALVLLGGLLLSTIPALAQQQGYQYVAKFICGDADYNDARGLDLNDDGIVDTGQFIARGEYSTVINVHNPNDRFVNMNKKIALDGYQIVDGRPRFLYQQPGDVFWINHVNGTTPPLADNFPDADSGERYFSLTPKPIELSPDEAFQINCAEIRAVVNDWTNRSAPTRAGDTADAVNAAGQFGTSYLIKGYLVIFSEAQLDVTAIYTACGEGASSTAIDCGNGVQTVDMETIKANVVSPPADLVPPAPGAAGLVVAGQKLQINLQVSRFSAIAETRLVVFDTIGRQVYDTGFTAGTRLSWRPQAVDGRPLANGVYLAVVMVKDVFGNVGYRVSKFAWLR